ncbi:hypothetical protein pqer_cds_265 [Pandoravirus quercus]|uniref:Uncharacterized protein n=2 Tax=Pandoravirus TaxID=2060084 RepID=A0A2U7U8C7_9VIRU|nr:hypothetical protein pqer_cds_265 [Pandoravirus quercus]AVK74687.1 hypothetical protein pqer_cds_265 [Pandoravirus quercus]QBZ80864.1 hypothetical protein pclt_cds_266 [Pandoravirus celtis]
MSTTAGSRTTRTRRGARANIGQGALAPLTSVDLGLPALPNISRPDQRGRLLGFARGGEYNNKLQILLTPDVVAALNGEMEGNIRRLETAAGTLPPEQRSYLSAGLWGPIGPQGQAEPYLPDLQQFYQDDRAQLYIPASADAAAAIGLVVPGSFRQLEALRAGVPAGQVVVKNPNNRNGYLKVGSEGWRDVITAAANGESRASREDIENFIGQGALYGLAPVFRENNIDVTLVGDYDAQGNYLGDANGNVRLALVAPSNIKTVADNKTFLRNVADWYTNFGLDPGPQQKGRAGAAAVGSAHAGRTVAPNGETDPESLNQSISTTLDENGNVIGAYGWAPEFATPASRRGLTAFGLVDPNTGIPLANPSDPSGVCPISSYGPGTTGNANANGKGVPGYRTTKRMVRHATGPPTYYCAPTSAYTTNPNRNVFQAGGPRALTDESANQALNRRGAALDEYFTAQGADQFIGAFDANAQSANYVQWLNDPQGTEGTNPLFMVPANQGSGFSFAGPALWQQDMDPAMARQFAGLNISQGYKAAYSNDVLDRLLNPGAYQAGAAPIGFGKPGGPSGVANPLYA